MASQSHRRIGIDSDPPKTPDSPFTYRPLDLTVDGIRLLILEPASKRKEVVRCQLKHVTFAEKPRYETLSYTCEQQYFLLVY